MTGMHTGLDVRANRGVPTGWPALDRRAFVRGLAGMGAALVLGGAVRHGLAPAPAYAASSSEGSSPSRPDDDANGSDGPAASDAAGTPGSAGEPTSFAQTTDAGITPREAAELANTAYPDAHLAGLTYSNLASSAAVEEVRAALLDSGVEAARVETVMAWVAGFNDCMRGCPSFELVGDFRQIEDGVVDYGSYYEKSTQWFKANKRDYHDVLCRIVAFELGAPNVTVAHPVPREAWPAGEFEDMGTDGFILFGGAAGNYHGAYVSYPLLSWDDDALATYWTLFCPIEVDLGLRGGQPLAGALGTGDEVGTDSGGNGELGAGGGSDSEASGFNDGPDGEAGEAGEAAVRDAVSVAWKERGVSFGIAGESASYRMLTIWGYPASGGRVCNYHAAVVCPCGDDLLLFEKVNPEDPYAATYFETIEQVKAHLWGELAIDNSRYGDPDPGPLAFFLDGDPV